MTDRDEIVDLTIRYATAIDSEQYELLSTVFTETPSWTTARSASGPVRRRSPSSWSLRIGARRTPCTG